MEPKGVVRTPAWIQRLAPRVRRPANAPENEDVTTNNLKHERLGKKELGPYAYEDRMPAKLERLLRNEDQIHGNNAPALLIPLLKRILEKCGDIHTAYLCHPGVQYLHKIKGEGNNFCGYRNMQMLINYLINAGLPGGDFFAGGIPSVLELQDRVEEAWAKGFNAHGRIQTGGVAGTRKHVGTPEAQALFRSLNIKCGVRIIKDSGSRVQKPAGYKSPYDQLCDLVEDYFTSTTRHLARDQPVSVLDCPVSPIYLQRPHHSMTIVGYFIDSHGSRNLLVFDPAYSPDKKMIEISRTRDMSIEKLMAMLKPYIRGVRQLGRYHAFELLYLT